MIAYSYIPLHISSQYTFICNHTSCNTHAISSHLYITSGVPHLEPQLTFSNINSHHLITSSNHDPNTNRRRLPLLPPPISPLPFPPRSHHLHPHPPPRPRRHRRPLHHLRPQPQPPRRPRHLHPRHFSSAIHLPPLLIPRLPLGR